MRSGLADSVASILIVSEAVFFLSVTQRAVHQRQVVPHSLSPDPWLVSRLVLRAAVQFQHPSTTLGAAAATGHTLSAGLRGSPHVPAGHMIAGSHRVQSSWVSNITGVGHLAGGAKAGPVPTPRRKHEVAANFLIAYHTSLSLPAH